MNTVAILQARMTSNRLPGKVLMKVSGKTILDWVMQAVKKTRGVDSVCVAIPTGNQHDPIEAEAINCGGFTVRGSEENVLERFALAARKTNADVIMRVTTDCPMSNPQINAKVLKLLIDNRADYACNNEPFSYPHGLDCEVFTRKALDLAVNRVSKNYDREHVTPWIKRNEDFDRRYLIAPAGYQASWRWTIDFFEDLVFFRTVAEILGDDVQNYQKVANLLVKQPDLIKINLQHYQRFS